jgi:hypothetical protein
MQCLKPPHLDWDRIELLVLGRLDPAEVQDALAHLASCPDCLALFLETNDYVETMQAALNNRGN